jgi:oligopeptide/dipeptide ABC transporter ATP-binding protein
MSSGPVLEVRGLSKTYSITRSIGRKESVRGVEGVSFTLDRASILGIVGESGSGKSTVGKCVLGLQTLTAGEVLLDGVRIDGLRPRAFRPFRRRLQMVFQMPQRSFDPLMSVSASVGQPLRRLRPDLGSSEQHQRVREVLSAVSLPDELWSRRPSALSGGQLQRAAIARALAPEPDVIFLDEPTSALDMSVRGEVLSLLGQLRERFGVAMVYVSHDLDAVQAIADHLLVMYLGEVVESGPAAGILTEPRHPYTQALLAAGRFDTSGPHLTAREAGDEGTSGCRLLPRCPSAIAGCEVRQELVPVGTGRLARCWRAA